MMKIEARMKSLLLGFALVFGSHAYAADLAQPFFKTRDWSIFKMADGTCYVSFPAYPPKTGRTDVLSLISDKKMGLS